MCQQINFLSLCGRAVFHYLLHFSKKKYIDSILDYIIIRLLEILHKIEWCFILTAAFQNEMGDI